MKAADLKMVKITFEITVTHSKLIQDVNGGLYPNLIHISNKCFNLHLGV